LASAQRGLTADAGIQYFEIDPAAIQFLLQQVWPAFCGFEAVTRRQAVAEYQYVFCGGRSLNRDGQP
jgi:hypothetical protein